MSDATKLLMQLGELKGVMEALRERVEEARSLDEKQKAKIARLEAELREAREGKEKYERAWQRAVESRDAALRERDEANEKYVAAIGSLATADQAYDQLAALQRVVGEVAGKLSDAACVGQTLAPAVLLFMADQLRDALPGEGEGG